MAEKTGSLIRGRGVVRSLVEWVIEYRSAIWAMVGTTLMSYVGAITDRVAAYGPAGIALFGIAAGYLLVLMALLASVVHAKYTRTRLMRHHAESATVNVLADDFRNIRIRLSDFFHPYFQATTGARFQDCEMIGPSNVVILDHCSLDDCGFIDCQAVIVKTDVALKGASGFRKCAFSRCKFFGATFFLPKDLYDRMIEMGADPKHFPIISEGGGTTPPQLGSGQ